MSDQADAAFKALADPTRRGLLDALFGRDAQSVTELSACFPEMTRFGVMKHLGILTEANLVVSHKRGRHTLYHLNPVPLEQIASRWLDKYAVRHAAALNDFAAAVELTAGLGANLTNSSNKENRWPSPRSSIRSTSRLRRASSGTR